MASRHRYGQNPSHYPLRAIGFILKHPQQLLRKVAVVVCLGMTVAVICLILLFAFALKPQAELFGGEWWSWLLAVFAVLLEAGLAAAVLIAFTQSRSQTEIFVTTMRIQGKWRENEMRKQSVIKDFSFWKKAYFLRILTYPFNFVPVVGAALYSVINSLFIGFDYMDRYFDSIQLSSKLQRIEVYGEDRSDCRALWSISTYNMSNPYAKFGFWCAFLEALPAVGPILFPLTNACAAALFACDIESHGGPSSLPAASNATSNTPTSNDTPVENENKELLPTSS